MSSTEQGTSSASPAEPTTAPESVAAPEAPESFYYVHGKDKVVIKVSAGALQHSALIDGMISNLGYTEEQAKANPFPFDNIDGDILKIAVERYKPPKQVNVPEWDQKFLEGIDKDGKLFDLVIAVNYLEIKELLTYCCKQVAMMIKGKSPEEIREIYMIPTDEEDAAAEKEAKERAKKEAAGETAAAGEGEAPSTSDAK
ncbi:Protein CBG00496 [Caenorhabditis briggsae]|uniref:Skp1-related protein n=1 Tax=Caenorhabditis briggsae TaxID=6238 RepID=A8WMT1_CAEBR|nr:Protein CBG00496 [Caenorhabditis briggsae]CAP21786.1 Protein CBG00496 [Caenorhabditis briggsae]